MRTQNVNVEDYDVYYPLIADLELYKHSSVYINLRFLIRRIVLVASIALLTTNKYQWLQIVIFIFQNLLASTFTLYALPFIEVNRDR